MPFSRFRLIILSRYSNSTTVRGSNPDRGKRIYSSSKRKIGLEVHPASLSVGPSVKWPGPGVNNSPPSGAD